MTEKDLQTIDHNFNMWEVNLIYLAFDYLTSYFIFDVLSSLPILEEDNSYRSAFKFFRVLRVFRILKSLKNL